MLIYVKFKDIPILILTLVQPIAIVSIFALAWLL